MKRTFLSLLIASSVLFLASCDEDSADMKQNAMQEQILKQSVDSVGMPNILNFQEKRILKEIYELRDRQIPTTTYLFDLYGHLHKLCDSIGYGIPYATQYTNPEYITYQNGSSHIIPQADPNGLYSPASAEGTWVLCLDPKTKKTKPVYVEPRIVVSPIALKVKKN